MLTSWKAAQNWALKFETQFQIRLKLYVQNQNWTFFQAQFKSKIGNFQSEPQTGSACKVSVPENSGKRVIKNLGKLAFVSRENCKTWLKMKAQAIGLFQEIWAETRVAQ